MAESGAATGQQQRPIFTRASGKRPMVKQQNMSNTEYHTIFLYHKISVFNKTEKHNQAKGYSAILLLPSSEVLP